MSYIKFKDVSVYFQGNTGGEVTALDNLNVEFEKGTINVIIGASGSGKTTLLNCIANKVLYNGEIFIDNQEIKNTKVQNRKISYVNQEATLYPGLTVYENIAFPLVNSKEKYDVYDPKVKDVASKLGITFLLTRKPKFISVGQASRVCIARAIAKKSDIYLFDEPLSHLDNENKTQIINIIKNIVKNNDSTFLYVTHDINEAFKLADYVYVLDEGKLVAKCSQDELLKQNNEIVQKLLVELKNEEV